MGDEDLEDDDVCELRRYMKEGGREGIGGGGENFMAWWWGVEQPLV